jgi:hypothetical protein
VAALSNVNSQKIYMTKPRIGGTHELDLILPRASAPQRATQTERKPLMPYVTIGKENGENNGTLKTYKGYPHGMPTTEAGTINADLIAFIKS